MICAITKTIIKGVLTDRLDREEEPLAGGVRSKIEARKIGAAYS